MAARRSAKSPPISHGDWVLVPDAPLAPGDRQLSLEVDPSRPAEPARRYGRCRGAVGDALRLGRAGPVDPRRPAAGRCRQAGSPRGSAAPDRTVCRQSLSLDTAEYSDGSGELTLSGHAAAGARRQSLCRRPAARHGHRRRRQGNGHSRHRMRKNKAASNCASTNLRPIGSVARRVAVPLEPSRRERAASGASAMSFSTATTCG